MKIYLQLTFFLLIFDLLLDDPTKYLFSQSAFLILNLQNFDNDLKQHKLDHE